MTLAQDGVKRLGELAFYVNILEDGEVRPLFFRIEPADGIEKYIGAWGHMLAASDDLIDMIHTHPFIADGGPEMQFNVYFPRERTYRIWVQFQRKGVVNTAQFDVPVQDLK